MQEISEVDVLNYTEMESDSFWTGDVEVDDDLMMVLSLQENFLTYTFIVSIITDLLSGTVMILVHSFLIYVFCNFKQLRTRQNLIILHCSVIDLYFQVHRIVFFFMYQAGVFFSDMFCVEYELNHLIMCLYFFLALILALDWIVCKSKPLLSCILQKYWKITLGGVYSIFLVTWVMATTTCFSRDNWIIIDLRFIKTAAFLVASIFLIAINVSVKKYAWDEGNDENIFALYIANAIILSFIPELIIHTFLGLTEHIIVVYILLYVAAVPNFIVNVHFALVFYVYRRHNKSFELVAAKCFNRSAEFYDIEHLVEDDTGIDEDSIRNACTTTNDEMLIL